MVDRRSFLCLLGVVFGSGCAGQTDVERQLRTTDGNTSFPGSTDDVTPEAHVRPDSNPTETPSLQPCEMESAVRVDSPASEIAWGGTDDFPLRVSDLSVEFGDSVRITFTNTTEETVTTGTSYQYNVEAYTDDGWREVRVSRSGTPQSYDDIEIAHEPGEGFVWEFTIREDNLAGAPVHDSSIETCPDLEPGRYRFVYWGGPGSAAPAVAFDVRRPE